jgi:uncharacterized protein YutD
LQDIPQVADESFSEEQQQEQYKDDLNAYEGIQVGEWVWGQMVMYGNGKLEGTPQVEKGVDLDDDELGD